MTTSEKFVQPAIPRFDGHYDFWSMTMENFLRSKELWQLVEDGIPTLGTTPTEAQRRSVAEAQLKDLKVKNFLFQAIDREILETMLDKSTPQAIWRSMQQKYQGLTRVKRAQLQAPRHEFELLAMKDGEKVDSYLGRTLSIVSKMKSNGEVMDSSTVVSKILKSLTTNFNYVYECPGVAKQAHYTTFEEATEVEDEILLVAYEEVTHPVQMEDWFLDSGCSNHMTGNKLWFT
ncbi:gag-polypeptide of LTR copia-type [Sesbania bispinosa]|nr:gag-polypeptide of LTR copia-type [Sesbania bispinosa]